jgi:transcriptional regulator with XRE-family HTH domain
MTVNDRLKLLTGQPRRATLGTLLRYARNAAQIEQGTMADELGYSRQSVSQFERDQVIPTRAVIIAWCLVTGCDFDPLDAAHRDAWRDRNGGTKRTSVRHKAPLPTFHNNTIDLRDLAPVLALPNCGPRP